MQPLISELKLRARYAETDAMGIIHHSSYIVWFEAGRVEYLRQIGSNYTEVEKGGHSFAASEIGARYVAPAYFDDLIIVRTTLEDVRSRTIAFRYEILHAESGKLLVTGSTRHVCINSQGEVANIPKEVRTLLEGQQQGN